MMRRLALLLALLLAHPAAAQPVSWHFDAEALAAAGVERPSEVLDLVPLWTPPLPTGTAPAWDDLGTDHAARWALVVDGRPVPAGLWGRLDPDRALLAPGQVDSLRVVAGPAWFEGEVFAGGVMYVFLTPPAAGPEVAAGAWGANPSGDPGPGLYLDARATNVERRGPDVWAAASVAGRPGAVRLTALQRARSVTSQETSARLARVTQRSIDPLGHRITTTGVRAEAFVGAQRLDGGFGATDDVFFLPFAGRELPLRHRAAHLSADGPVAGRPWLAYRVGHARNAARERPNIVGFDPGWHDDRTHAALVARGGRRGWQAEVGIRGELRRVEAHALPADGTSAARLWLTVAKASAGRAAVAVHRSAGRLDVDADAALHLRARGRLRLAATRAAQGPYAGGSLWPWLASTPALAGAFGVAVEGLPPSGVRRHALSVEWAPQGAPLQLRGALVHASGWLAQQAYAFDGESYAAPARVVRGARAAGWHVRLGAEGAARPARGVRIGLGYRWERSLAGDAAFRAARAGRPAHVAVLSATLRPDDRFSLRAGVRLESRARWPTYSGVANASGGRYDEAVGPRPGLDLTAAKRFWGTRGRVSLTVSNVLDRRDRRHPLGERPRLALGASLRLRFGGHARQR